MYMILKMGIYEHGVFYIGTNLETAKDKAREYALNDTDDYHEWVVIEYKEIPLNEAHEDPCYKWLYQTNKVKTK